MVCQLVALERVLCPRLGSVGGGAAPVSDFLTAFGGQWGAGGRWAGEGS